MVQAIIFDLGDVFLNKNPEAQRRALAALGLTDWDSELQKLERRFEVGAMSREYFIKTLQQRTNNASESEIADAWNASIGDFPLKRLEFLQKLSENYRLFLLSNTDSIHIEKFEHDTGSSFYGDFYQCFEKVYYSHETGVRKPDAEAFNMLIKNHNLHPKRTLMVDDKKANTDVAEALGMKVWTLLKEEEDVTQLFDRPIFSLEKSA
ncbi:HAD family hydrolase [Flavobacterium sp. RHBU_3]|uniref:HAD family hydrolase n=1 Tax=Flavobacterium sp. RHBU_3 TaxID=3391184 RepID=UPI00398467AB